MKRYTASVTDESIAAAALPITGLFTGIRPSVPPPPQPLQLAENKTQCSGSALEHRQEEAPPSAKTNTQALSL